MRTRPPSVVPPSSRGHASPTEALLTAAVWAALAASLPAQPQFDELRKRGLPPDRDFTRAVALGDVDGDGDLDVVFANQGKQNRLYVNDGNGVYNDATAAAMPVDSDDTLAVALGDVDSDGDLDIAIGNGIESGARGQQNRLYLNDGDGTFTDATAFRIPIRRDLTRAVALNDVDNDGDHDLVIGNHQQSRLYLNDGSGTFTDVTATHMPAGGGWAAALGDVDRDGDFDMIFGNGNSGQNRLYLNDGSGVYTDATAARMPADSDSTNAVALGDVDRDGDLDIVFGNGGQNRLYLNDGSGAFSDATTAQVPPVFDPTKTAALGDTDGDGDLDIVFGNGARGQQNRLYLNDGTGIYTDATAEAMPADSDSTRVAVLGDIDNDGDLDVLIGNDYGHQNRLYTNDGTGDYSDATRARMPADTDRTSAVALGDVDCDGDLDMVLGTLGFFLNGDQNRLYLNDGTGTYTDETAARMPTVRDSTWDVALGDVDRDGDLDIVFGGYWGQSRLYINDGTGTFSDGTAARLPYTINTPAVALGDVDGDSDLDIVFGRSYVYGEQNQLYLNDGTGIFTDATATHMPIAIDYTLALALGDVDSDGDPDIVFGNQGQNRLCLNDGTGIYADATAARFPSAVGDTRSVALGDIDGDGDLDLIVGNSGDSGSAAIGQQNRLYLNDGTGAYTDATATRMPSDNGYTNVVALGDVDGDSDLDVLCGNTFYRGSLAQQSRLYINDGSGTYADATAARMQAGRDSSRAEALGDVDGDGDLDIVFGNDRQNRLYLNLLQQLDAPFAARIGHTYTLEAYSRYGPPSLVDVALPFISPAPATIPFPPFGTIGLDPARIVGLSPFVIPQPAGLGSVSFTVPNLPGLTGASVYAQALLVPYPFQARLTNVTADVVIR